MPKQNHNAGLESSGPHRQGEKGGKGGTIKKAGKSAGGGSGKTQTDEIGPYSTRDNDKRAKTPTVSGKGNPKGKGSGNR